MIASLLDAIASVTFAGARASLAIEQAQHQLQWNAAIQQAAIAQAEVEKQQEIYRRRQEAEKGLVIDGEFEDVTERLLLSSQ